MLIKILSRWPGKVLFEKDCGRQRDGACRHEAAREGEIAAMNSTKEVNVHKFQARQGDVFIEAVDEIPAGAVEKKPEAGRVVLAYGEVTGHAHAFYGNGVRWFAPNDQGVGYFEVTGETALLKHEEHTEIPHPKGKYRYRRQREYIAPELQRTVAD